MTRKLKQLVKEPELISHNGWTNMSKKSAHERQNWVQKPKLDKTKVGIDMTQNLKLYSQECKSRA